jgi:hypothetical protein
MNPYRFVFAVLLALFTAVSVPTFAATAETGERTLPADQRLELKRLFALSPGVLADDENGVTFGPIGVQVLVARIVDGKLVKSCVNSEEAAIRFFETPSANLETKAAQER